MLRRVLSALVACAVWLACAPAFAAGPLAGNVRQVDPYWPNTNPNSGCWTVQVRNQKTSWTPDTAPSTLQELTPGFGLDAAGKIVPTIYNDTRVITGPVRQPWKTGYPSSGFLYTGDRAALDDYIIQGAVLPGIKNNCNTPAPLAVGQWASPGRFVAGNTLPDVDVLAFHHFAQNNQSIRGIRCTADDANGHTVSGDSTTEIDLFKTGDQWHLSGFRCPHLDLSTLTNAHYAKLDICLYPWRGTNASVYCTNNFPNGFDGTDGSDLTNTSGRAAFSTLIFYKDTGNPLTAYICLTNDGTCGGAGSTTCTASTTDATALASPCSTWAAAGKALAAAGGIDNALIKIGQNVGTPPLIAQPTSGLLTQSGGCLTVTRNATTTRAQAVVNFGTGASPAINTLTNVNNGCIHFTDMTSTRPTSGGNLSLKSTAAGCPTAGRLKIIWDQVTLDLGVSTNTATWLSCSDDEFYGVTLANWATGPLGAAGAGHHRFYRGIAFPVATALELHTLVASALPGVSGTAADPNGGTADGQIVAFNSIAGASTPFQGVASAVLHGLADVANTFENVGTASNNIDAINNDAFTNSIVNSIWQQNSYTGFDIQGRVNRYYDQAGTPRYTLMQSCIGNAPVALYTKSDIFDGDNDLNANAQSRVGSWPFGHGVGCRDQFLQYNTAVPHSETPVYVGLNSTPGVNEVTRNDPKYTTDGGTTSGPTTGAGSTNFVPQSGSPLIGAQKVGTLPYDNAGNLRNTAGADTIGAFCRATAGSCQ